jgi:phosphocarrier protein HPr
MSELVTKTVIVSNENGLHLVPCSLIAQTAANFAADLHLTKGNLVVDAKNIFELMSLAAGKGTELTASAQGDDASTAIDSIVELFESGFPTPTT